jgi:hypothetical protein
MTYVRKSKRKLYAQKNQPRLMIIEVQVSASDITHATLKDVILVCSPSKDRVFQQAVDRFTVLQDGELKFR